MRWMRNIIRADPEGGRVSHGAPSVYLRRGRERDERADFGD